MNVIRPGRRVDTPRGMAVPGGRRPSRVGRALMAFALLPLAFSTATSAAAQDSPTYVQFSPLDVKGALYEPAGESPPSVGILIMHRTGNFLSHSGTRELVRRGFLVLGMNPRFDNNEAAVRWEEIALDVRSGVEYLRSRPGIEHVVLFGHSGGGPTMSFYQAVAENGPSYCRGAEKLVECDDRLDGLPAADGLVLVDAHPGNPVNGLRSLSPAVVDEDDPSRLDPSLDPFDPVNGYDPDGRSSYSAAFRERYFRAQADRMNRLIERALVRLETIRRDGTPYPDDDAFLVVRGDGARLMQMDPDIHGSTRAPRKLLRNDGSIETRVVESVRRPSRGLPAENASFEGGTRLLTLRSFLSANAVRSSHSLDGIDHCSSNNSTPCALQSISAPLLVVAAGAHYFVRDNEIHYEVSASEDKDFVVVEGATHGFSPCTACEAEPGQYSNSMQNFYDYVADWVDARF